MNCLSCLHYAPVRVCSMANATITRIKPCQESDFDPRLLNTLAPPMTDEAFNQAVKTYYCESWQERGGVTE